MFYYKDRALELSKELRYYEELEIDIKQLTGYNFAALRELFTAGWTLQPPAAQPTLTKMLTMNILEKEN